VIMLTDRDDESTPCSSPRRRSASRSLTSGPARNCVVVVVVGRWQHASGRHASVTAATTSPRPASPPSGRRRRPTERRRRRRRIRPLSRRPPSTSRRLKNASTTLLNCGEDSVPIIIISRVAVLSIAATSLHNMSVRYIIPVKLLSL